LQPRPGRHQKGNDDVNSTISERPPARSSTDIGRRTLVGTPIDAGTWLDSARQLVARGLSVIPVPMPQDGVPPGEPGDGKTPMLPWREYQTRLPTDRELTEWFGGAAMNVAVITGALSRVVVVDADASDALRWCTRHLAYTPWQTQTARGFHLWYRHPGVVVPNRARLATEVGRLAIDVRGDGGYVIAPWSLHASGVEYEYAGDWTVPIEQIPRFQPGWVQRAARPVGARPATPRMTGDVVERARRYLAAIPPPQIGCGSDRDTLYAACRLIRGFELSAADAEALVWEWAGGRQGWTRDWVARKVAHAQRYGSEPLGALR
jgi:hypothetical protein